MPKQIQHAHPGVRVVKSLNTMAAPLMVDPGRVPGDHVVFVTGNDIEAKKTVRALLKQFGWEDDVIHDIGDVRASRGPEMYAYLLFQIAASFGSFDFNIAINRAASTGEDIPYCSRRRVIMSRILITGSADGLGRLTAEALHAQGNDVIVHARNTDRAEQLRPLTDQGAGIVIGDFADRGAVRRIAAELVEQAPLDAVIHNVGVWSGRNVMPVNIIAPYLLTALLPFPERLVYLSSGSHFGGQPRLDGVDWQGKRAGSYSDSKLYVSTLAVAIARLYPDVLSNSVDPGWVPTRMGGAGAPDSLELGHRTQEWLATSNAPEARTSGGYWHHQRRQEPHPSVHDTAFQDRLLSALADETGERLPRR